LLLWQFGLLYQADKRSSIEERAKMGLRMQQKLCNVIGYDGSRKSVILERYNDQATFKEIRELLKEVGA